MGRQYVEGAPELIVEYAFSSASIDLHQKLNLYQSAGVQEYLVLLLKKQEVRWHLLVNGKISTVGARRQRNLAIIRFFPGLWLDSAALFDNDISKVLAKLQEGIASPEHQRFLEHLAAKR